MIAEPPVECFGHRRLGELSDVGLERPEIVELVAQHDARIDVAAVLAIEDVAVEAQRRDQPDPVREIDAEVGVDRGAEQLRAAEDIGRRDVHAARARDAGVVDREQRFIRRHARHDVDARVEMDRLGDVALESHPIRQVVGDDAERRERAVGAGFGSRQDDRVAAPRGRDRELQIAAERPHVRREDPEELRGAVRDPRTSTSRDPSRARAVHRSFRTGTSSADRPRACCSRCVPDSRNRPA